MPPLVAAAAITAGGAIAGGALSAHASGKAADAETAAANHAADVQAKAAADALAFQKTQAAQDLATANTTQKANYDQWSAREGRLSNLSALTGGGRFDIPAYVPIANVNAVTPNGLPPGTRPDAPVLRPASPQAPISSPYQATMADAMMPQPVASPAVSPSGGAGVVTLKSPTGEVRQFLANDPKIHVHIDRGAVRVA